MIQLRIADCGLWIADRMAVDAASSANPQSLDSFPGCFNLTTLPCPMV
jgi:hypothetical protein